MSKSFDPRCDETGLHGQIGGLDEHSSSKSYLPELQSRLRELQEEVKRRELLEDELHLKNRLLEDEIAYRQKAEEDASIERDNAHAIFDAAPVGMMIVNESCRVIDANRALQAICDKKNGEIKDLVPGQVFECAYTTRDSRECGHAPECSACDLREIVRSVMRSRQPRYDIEIKLVRRKGETTENIWLKISVEPITVSDQACAIIAVDEITNRRRMEEELLRTHKLESLGVLAGGIAHDFNNLLTGVMGNLSVALLKTSSDDVRKPLEQALQAAERATNLTRQLLTFAKGGAPVKQLVWVVDIVRESAEFALRGANVACQFSAADDVWATEVDVGQLSQVISNLVINADQAMPGGGILRISIENAEFSAPSHNLPAGRYIRITISDEGVGIPEEHLGRIFDPYFTTKQSGSGLGLATVHSIITRHGGQIELSSEAGRGATFTLFLPASDRKQDMAQKESELMVEGFGRILVMDDEDFVRSVMAEMLDILGYECIACENGQQACELYQQAMEDGRPFSAVIMDLTIPGGMGGVEAMAAIRRIDPAARGIVASGYSSDPVVANYNNYGFVAAIPKPFTLRQIAETLYEVFTPIKVDV